VDRQAESTAFAKACTYLDYRKAAKWTAHLAGAGTALVYLGLLIILWAFADLAVFRGRLPSYHTLTQPEQDRFLQQWNGLDRKDRVQRLKDVGVEEDRAEKLADVTASPGLERDVLDDYLWRAQLGWILSSRVNTGLIDRVKIREQDTNNPRPEYDEVDNGLLSLVVRSYQGGKTLAPVVAVAAKWNPWTWNHVNDGRPGFASFLLGLLLIALTLGLLGVGLTFLMRDMAARTTIEAATRLRRAVYYHTFRLGTLAFRTLGPTEAVTVFTRHIEAVHDALQAQLTSFYRDFIKFLLLLAFALVVQPYLAIAFMLFAVFIWLVGGQIVAHYRKQGRLALNQAGERLTIMRESLMMMRLVKCYLMDQFNSNRVERQLSRYAQVQMIRYRGEAIYQPVLTFLGLTCAAVLLYVAGLIALSGQMGVAGMIALATAVVSMYRPLRDWFESRRLIKRGQDSADQLFRFLDRRPEVGQVVGAKFLDPLAEQIEFDNVTLREPGSSRLLLEEVTLTIPAGQRIGLIGADDLEKHALAYLIPRMLDPTSGEIRIDGNNLRWVTLDSLRNQIAVVLQHNLVFHDTVANNIGCGDASYSLPQIIDAAKLAHAHHFIQKLPQGYETPIGELGHPLTASQQYRIALARAILRDPALLIVEEPQVDLDEDTKSLLDDTMSRILPDRTVIFLPHRISTIRSCDRLYLLHKGKVAAAGVHKELLSQNALYRHLHYLEFNEMDEQLTAH
jgi:ATP-binding cassette subfamily B protein